MWVLISLVSRESEWTNCNTNDNVCRYFKADITVFISIKHNVTSNSQIFSSISPSVVTVNIMQ